MQIIKMNMEEYLERFGLQYEDGELWDYPLEETEIKNYDCEELEKEIIKRWEEQRVVSIIKDCGTMNSLLNTLMENRMRITRIGANDCFSDEQIIEVESSLHKNIKITYQVLDTDNDDMVESINVVKINDTEVNQDNEEREEVISEGIKLIKEWLGLMEYEIIRIDNDTVEIYDRAEGEKRLDETAYWCEEIIDMIKHKIAQDEENTQMVEQFTREMDVLKKLSEIN